MTLMPSSIALLFPGQGSHAEGMDEPYRGHPLFERGLDLLGHDPFERLSEGTRFQQPALFLCSVAAWDQWRAGEDDDADDDAGEAIAAAGHSLGEYAALVAAGALQFDDAVKLVDERADAMADAGEQRAGGMIAMLGGESRDVRALADRLGLVVANDNAPGQLVLSGERAALQAAGTSLREAGVRVLELNVAGAFHSPFMADAVPDFAEALGATYVRAPRIEVWSCVTARPMDDVRRRLAEGLTAPVRWRETVINLHEAGFDRFVDVGPGKVLAKLVKRIAKSAELVHA